MRLPATILLALAMVLVAGLGRARAEAGRTAAIVTRGDTNLAAQVRKTAGAWLDARGVQLRDGALDAKTTARLADCLASTPDGCADVIARASVDRLWFFVLQPNMAEGGVDVVLHLFAGDGRRLASGSRFCEGCHKDRLAVQVEKVLGVVSEAASALTSARTVVRVRTDPPGARVTVGGTPVGTAAPEIAYDVLPGSYEVTAHLDGYQPATRRIELDDGEEKAITLTLEPAAGGRVGNGGSRSALPYALGGAGVVAVAGGITLFALHSPATRDGVEQYQRRELLVPAAALTVAGAAAIGAGAYLVVRSRRARAGAQVAPAVSVTPAGVHLGVMGGF